jgi:hypothetical protein
MGIQTNIKLRCTVGNIIYYQWKGIHCIRTVPAKVRQTAPTKKAATDFGIAVKCSAVVRSLFRPLLPEPANRSIIYKTDAAFRKWLKENPLDNTEPVNGIPYFNGLSFNDGCDLQKIIQLKVAISRGADGGLLLQWPAFNPVTAIKAPTGTKQIVVKYIIATLDMNNAGQHECAETAFTIPYTDDMIPAKEIQFENATGFKCIALVGMAIRYYKDGLQSKPINILRRKPAGIADSFYN